MPRNVPDIERLERLAHLDLDAQERGILAGRLARLLDWCGELPGCPEDEGPSATADVVGTLRDDVVRSSPVSVSLSPGDPRFEEGFVRTPPPSGRCDDRD